LEHTKSDLSLSIVDYEHAPPQKPPPLEEGKKTFFILCQQRAGLCVYWPCLRVCLWVGLCVCLHKDLSVNVGAAHPELERIRGGRVVEGFTTQGPRGAEHKEQLLPLPPFVCPAVHPSVSCSSDFVLLINRLLLPEACFPLSTSWSH